MKNDNREIIQNLLAEELSYKNCGLPHSQVLIASSNAWLAEESFYRLNNLERGKDANRT